MIMRLWRTVRWLRPVQIVGRAWLRLYRPRPAPAPPPDVRQVSPHWKGCSRSPSATGPDALRLLNEEHRIAHAADWNNSAWPKLWLYNAHYFDDLVATGASARLAWHRALVARWVEENPPGHGVGWEAYPTSLRIVNWIKWAWAGAALEDAVVHSLAVQARWLRRRLEWHLLGNHLWANAKALVFAGVFFEGAEADAWLAKGMALIDRELDAQILPDGGHFERSPMYHAIVLEDLLDLLQVASVHPQRMGRERIGYWRLMAPRMQRWLWAMTHPDGGLAFFNDATLGVAPDAADLYDYATRLDLDVQHGSDAALQPLPDSGYLRARMGPAVLLADAGEIGPDYLPGHGHADTLSCELSLHGHRMLVNSGISTYEPDDERLRQRGTAAHNTLEVDGLDSSEVWSAFRVGRRARPRDVSWSSGPGISLGAAHDGYRWRPGRPVHRRAWHLAQQGLTVTDQVEGRCRQAVVHYHLHPDWEVGIITENEGWLQRGDVRVRWWIRGDCRISLREGTWHPGFSLSVPNQAIVLTMLGACIQMNFNWE